jgi:hypothetical protein
MKWFAMLSASVLCGAPYASAGEWPPENTPFLGAQCYTVNEQTLHLTQDDYFSGQKFPVILDSPEAGAKPVGRVAAIFYVTWPLKIENGFVQVLHHMDGLGWIPKSAIRPLRKADGSPGGCRLWWGKDGRVMFALDPGVSIRN